MIDKIIDSPAKCINQMKPSIAAPGAGPREGRITYALLAVKNKWVSLVETIVWFSAHFSPPVPLIYDDILGGSSVIVILSSVPVIFKEEKIRSMALLAKVLRLAHGRH